MTKPILTLICAVALTPMLPQPGNAEEAMALTYEAFEQSVPHIDLAVCPEPLQAPGRFCRLTTHADALNVFVFSEDGDQPLIAMRSWSGELLVGLMD